jgi:hypothetical protein
MKTHALDLANQIFDTRPMALESESGRQLAGGTGNLPGNEKHEVKIESE